MSIVNQTELKDIQITFQKVWLQTNKLFAIDSNQETRNQFSSLNWPYFSLGNTHAQEYFANTK